MSRRTVTMPYAKSDFNEALQEKYKLAIASAAGAPVDNVDIVSITEKRRRAGSVDVETKVLCLLPSLHLLRVVLARRRRGQHR
jgi:hypothetical protein